MLICKKCNSENMKKDGWRTLSMGKVQRYRCGDCGSQNNGTESEIDEAKRGNIPEIGLSENLQGLEVTGVTYLKKDENNVLKWIKTKAKANSVDMLTEFADRLINRVPVAELITPPQKTDCSLLTQYTVTDLHVGMYSWPEETGASWDLKECYETITAAIDIAIQSAPESQIGFFLQNGDFFHYSSHESVTPTNHNLLDSDGRFQKMIEVGEDIVLETIDKLLLKHEQVKVIIAQGNHDLSVSDTLRSLVKRYYSKNTRVEVIGGPNPFYAYKHGLTMIGAHHGHLKKRVKLPSHFAQNFSKMWGDTTHRYIHSGHLHCQHEEWKEDEGAMTIQHATICAPDAYAAHRFSKSLRSINTIIYSDKYGIISRNIIPYEMVVDYLTG